MIGTNQGTERVDTRSAKKLASSWWYPLLSAIAAVVLLTISLTPRGEPFARAFATRFFSLPLFGLFLFALVVTYGIWYWVRRRERRRD